jgi:hypothetical protein
MPSYEAEATRASDMNSHGLDIQMYSYERQLRIIHHKVADFRKQNPS